MNKMMKGKYDVYKAKGILGYRKGKIYVAAAKDNKRKEIDSGQRGKENTNRIEMDSQSQIK